MIWKHLIVIDMMHLIVIIAPNGNLLRLIVLLWGLKQFRLISSVYLFVTRYL